MSIFENYYVLHPLTLLLFIFEAGHPAFDTSKAEQQTILSDTQEQNKMQVALEGDAEEQKAVRAMEIRHLEDRDEMCVAISQEEHEERMEKHAKYHTALTRDKINREGAWDDHI